MTVPWPTGGPREGDLRVVTVEQGAESQSWIEVFTNGTWELPPQLNPQPQGG